MTKARDIASATTPNANAALLATFPHRNLIINGAMQVAQRGTSHTQSPNSGNYHTVDRFSYRRTGTWSGVTAVALSQESSGAPSGFTHFLRYAPTGSDSSTPSDTSMYIEAKLEGNSVSSLALGTSAAKSFTVSFYVRSSVTGTFSVAFNNNASPRFSYVAEYTINSANTWERKEVTVDAPTSGTFDTGTSAGLVFALIVSADSSSSTYGTSTVGSWLSSTDARWSSNQSDGVTTSANQTFDITGVQLELGDTATPFEHRSFGDELARCQRYYYNTYLTAQSSGSAASGLQAGTFNANDRYNVDNLFPVEMRSQPTVVYYGGRSGSANTADRVSRYNSDTVRSFVNEPVATLKGLRGYFDTNNNDSAIRYHFTANAEL